MTALLRLMPAVYWTHSLPTCWAACVMAVPLFDMQHSIANSAAWLHGRSIPSHYHCLAYYQWLAILWTCRSLVCYHLLQIWGGEGQLVMHVSACSSALISLDGRPRPRRMAYDVEACCSHAHQRAQISVDREVHGMRLPSPLR